jgi:hypothetical protein
VATKTPHYFGGTSQLFILFYQTGSEKQGDGVEFSLFFIFLEGTIF